MSILDDANRDLINYFHKFQERPNFSGHLERLEEISKYTLREMIEIEGMMIPDVGPSDEIYTFHETLDWAKQDQQEVQFAIKSLEGGEIESVEEFVLLVEILKRGHPEKKDTLEKITEFLEKGEIDEVGRFFNLLQITENSEDYILFGMVFRYLMAILQ
jgi:hypothetical protein